MTDKESEDIRAFILAHAGHRFQMTGPVEFEWLVRELFVRDGYVCTPGDQDDGGSGYFIGEKDGYDMVILPILAVPGHEPANDVLERAVRLRDVHQAEYVSVVTTGDFKPETVRAARRQGVEAWDWVKLEAAIGELFFDGDAIPTPESPVFNDADADRDPELRLKVKWEARTGVTSEWYNLEVAVTNLSTRHRYLHFELPVIVDAGGRQIAAGEWAEGEFTSGTVYAGATVHTNALFPVGRAGDKPPGGRVMLSCHERLDAPLTYHLAGRLKGEACFAVTYCFGRDSDAYRVMTRFRDERLRPSAAGRGLILLYYAASPRLIEAVERIPWLQPLFRQLVLVAVRFIGGIYPDNKN